MLAFQVDEEHGDDESLHGHDTHFLSRLSRVQARQAEYALSLYQDPELVRQLLADAGCTDAQSRVALALADGPDAPHVIVAGSGAFVTCLGAGMSTGGWQVVTHDRVEAIVDRVTDGRDRMRAYQAYAPKTLFRRLGFAGDTLTREEVHALTAISPLAPREFMTTMIMNAEATFKLQQALLRPHGRVGTRSELVEMHWRGAWSVGHITLLFGRDGESTLARTPEGARAEIARHMVARFATRQRVIGLVLRGLWAAGRVGAAMLAAWRDDLRDGVSSHQLVEIVAGAAVVAARHPELVRDAHALFARLPHELAEPALAIQDVCAAMFADPEVTTASWRAVGAALVVADGVHDDPADVPDALAFARATLQLGDTSSFASIALALPWLARAEVEDFYLPAAYLRASGRDRYHRARGNALAARVLAHTPRLGPARAPGRSQRNAPCACGSGRKSKRCCGAG